MAHASLVAAALDGARESPRAPRIAAADSTPIPYTYWKTGAFIGTAVFAALGTAVAVSLCNQDEACAHPMRAAVSGFALGAALGFPLGALIGGQFRIPTR